MKRYPANFEPTAKLPAILASKIIHNLPDDYFETYIEKVNSVELEDVNKLLLTVFIPPD